MKASLLLFTTLTVFSLSACDSYEPVAASECAAVIKHSQKVLGDYAPSYADLVRDCQGATDSERGCAMAATKKGQMLQCM